MPSSSEFAAVPANAGTTWARVWVGSTVSHPADPSRVWLLHPPTGAKWPVPKWEHWSVDGDPASLLRYQRVTIDGLRPDTRYRLVLQVEGQSAGSLEVTTLPERLDPERPFVAMLGSCFCRLKDAQGVVGRTFAHLPDGSKPHVKFLLGDQVYLDSPWYRFLVYHSPTALGRGFLEQYWQTWTQSGDRQGFNHLLSAGANYFCADDHEFWNNAPFPSFAMNTWRKAWRDPWLSQATALYDAFQAEDSANHSFTSMNVGALQIGILDTRVNRDHVRSKFVRDADMAALERWIGALSSPAVLVIGQPVFAPKTGVRGHIEDWNLPDFDQYSRLCDALLSSRQSILVVTGDVHYGRVAKAPLKSGAELIELISSPMALVDEKAGGSWGHPPGRFPAERMAGMANVSVTVTPEATWKRFAEHFVTLEFTERGGGFVVRVRTWETKPSAGVTAGMVVFEQHLKRVV